MARFSNRLREILRQRSPLRRFRALAAGEHVIGALFRRGELSIWNDGAQLLTWTPKQQEKLDGPSATLVKAVGVKLGARRTLPLTAIKFDDDFMRESGNGIWRPLSGRWELTGMAFPERSANPFSLRASFGNEKPADDALYKARFRPEQEYSAGFIISPMEGTLHIVRITGDSPAARAGMQEDDIFLEIDGQSVENMNPWSAYQLLAARLWRRGTNESAAPRREKLREFVITPETFRWATPSVGIAILPVNPPIPLDGDNYSLITAGEPGWSDYAAEVAVKPLGPGGMGLAVAVTSPKDYVMFRWRGPAGRKLDPAVPINEKGIYDRLQLVRAVDGQETILAECAAGYRPHEFYLHGRGLERRRHRLRTIDGNTMLSAKIPGLKTRTAWTLRTEKANRSFSTMFTWPPTAKI